jgi:hypothetical protein
MPMSGETFYKPDGVTQQRVVRLTGSITIGAAGAITAQSGTATSTTGGQQCGVDWSRSAAGDYRATLFRGFKRLIRGSADVSMPAVATAPTVAAGNLAFVQGALAANFSGATAVAKTGLSITTVRTDTNALADPTNGVTISYDIELAQL